jgi:hypothetical protein
LNGAQAVAGITTDPFFKIFGQTERHIHHWYYGQQKIQNTLPAMNLKQYAEYFNSVLNDPNSGVTNLTIGSSATLRWTLSTSGCGSNTDDVVITVNNLPTVADASTDQTLCNSTTATLAGNVAAIGTGTWTIVAGTATITTPASEVSGVTRKIRSRPYFLMIEPYSVSNSYSGKSGNINPSICASAEC